MAQRIYNLAKWCYVPEGSAMPFPNRRRRNVVLEVNASAPATLYVIQEKEAVERNPEKLNDDEAGRPRRTILPLANAMFREDDDIAPPTPGHVATFLCALSSGRDTIDFAVDGAFDLLAVGGDIYVYSQDSLQHEVRVVAPEVFTRLANRRQRNPQMEMMMWQQRQNIERRFMALAADAERRIMAAEKGAKERYAPQRDVRAPENRRVSGASAKGQGASSASGGHDVRTAGQDSGEGQGSSGVAGAEGVSPPAANSRTKAKSPA